ncbi:hypothetical protein NNJEOMEG_03743 [Fundidesulfovibrio magnetotacticus]|uniref:Type VI secretion system spike protein VgrG3-like C-terminal domain-containing protein n=1 Tax=Fundidesulfovibrio magnetotacticus TaxID=2730080 RepID=A0A6V8LYJ0_9BACT|nr:hypothetical protein [Fundidesulfovibrio magnetotacticus]GFK95870.1 hypothetical protein NNJEOMEG_03743 [Fundidesulfovibrio magnetotacticus]
MGFESAPGTKSMALNFMMDNGLMDNTLKMELAQFAPGQGSLDGNTLQATMAQQTPPPSDAGATTPTDGGSSAPEAGGRPPEAGVDTPSPGGATPYTHTFDTGARYTVDPYGRNGPRVDPTPLGELNAFKTGGIMDGTPPKSYPWQTEKAPRGAAVPAMRPDLGESVKQFESAGRGVGTVSSGINDPGGVSYGTYQLSTKAGTAQDFVGSPEGKPFQGEFAGLKPGTPEFSAKWKDIAARKPDGLHSAEQEYIYRTHYQAQAEMAAQRGFDTGNPAIQDAVWSGSIQHNKFGKVIDSAAKSNDLRSMSDADQLKALYESRGAYTDAQKALPLSAGRQRYARELPAVLERNREHHAFKQRLSYLWGE